MNKTLNYYQRNARSYDLKHRNDDLSASYALFQKNWLHKTGKRILDFGCGPGRDISYFLKRSYEVEAFDGCKEFCEIASKENNIAVQHANFYDINFLQNHYDGVFANSVIFHIQKERLPEILKRVHTSLKADGIFYSNIPLKHILNTEDNGTHINLMSEEEYLELLQSSGFTICEIQHRPLFRPRLEQNWLAVTAKKEKS